MLQSLLMRVSQYPLASSADLLYLLGIFPNAVPDPYPALGFLTLCPSPDTLGMCPLGA